MALASLQNFVRTHVNLTQEFAGWVKDSPLLELAAPVPLNLVCFRHRAGENPSRALFGETKPLRQSSSLPYRSR